MAQMAVDDFFDEEEAFYRADMNGDSLEWSYGFMPPTYRPVRQISRTNWSVKLLASEREARRYGNKRK
jgi:hypothetical protein